MGRTRGGLKILKRGGGGVPSAVEFFGSGDCFDALSRLSYVFAVRVKNEIHIVIIVC